MRGLAGTVGGRLEGWARVRGQMLRMMLEQVRRRRVRALAVVAGVLVAVTGFTVLTGSVSTQRAELTGMVQDNSRGAYDLLVRPAGSETPLEARRGLVRGNYLSGQYGGISAAQWHRIQQLSGVQTAAPIAMLGYVPIQGTAYVDATAQVDRDLTQQVVKVSNTWVTDRGLTKIPDPGAVYVYVTRNPVVWPQWEDPANPQEGTEYLYQGHAITPDTSSCGVGDPAVPGRGAAERPFRTDLRAWLRHNGASAPWMDAKIRIDVGEFSAELAR